MRMVPVKTYDTISISIGGKDGGGGPVQNCWIEGRISSLDASLSEIQIIKIFALCILELHTLDRSIL